MLETDLRKAANAVRETKAKTVAVQIPEGLKQSVLEIAEKIGNETGATVFTFIEPCYGACDLADEMAKNLGAELLLHLGHTRFIHNESVETVYLPLNYEIKAADIAVLAGKAANVLAKEKAVGVCATAQFLHLIPRFGKELGRKGFSVFVGKGKGVEKGQVLGCNYSGVKEIEGKVGAIVFLGDGLFHPLGISFCCSKRVIMANPLEMQAKELKGERDLFLRKRHAAIANAMDAKVFGILISTKKGQLRKKLALELKEKIEKKGRKAFLLAGNFIKAEYLLGMKIDAFVSTACPRLAIDDGSSFKQPLLSASELAIVLGEKKFAKYSVDELG